MRVSVLAFSGAGDAEEGGELLSRSGSAPRRDSFLFFLFGFSSAHSKLFAYETLGFLTVLESTKLGDGGGGRKFTMESHILTMKRIPNIKYAKNEAKFCFIFAKLCV